LLKSSGDQGNREAVIVAARASIPCQKWECIRRYTPEQVGDAAREYKLLFLGLRWKHITLTRSEEYRYAIDTGKQVLIAKGWENQHDSSRRTETLSVFSGALCAQSGVSLRVKPASDLRVAVTTSQCADLVGLKVFSRCGIQGVSRKCG